MERQLGVVVALVRDVLSDAVLGGHVRARTPSSRVVDVRLKA